MPYKMFDDNESAFNFDTNESVYEDIAHLDNEMPEYKPQLGTIRSTSSFVAPNVPSFLQIDEINNYLSPFSDFTASTAKSRYSGILNCLYFLSANFCFSVFSNFLSIHPYICDYKCQQLY